MSESISSGLLIVMAAIVTTVLIFLAVSQGNYTVTAWGKGFARSIASVIGGLG